MYTPFPEGVNRRLALILIAVGILLAPDVTVPTPGMDILLNLPLAMLIAVIFDMTFTEAMMATFILAYTLIAAGLLIYPYNTKRLLIGRLNAGIAFIRSNPYTMIAAFMILFLVWYMGNEWFTAYEEQLRSYITTLGGA